MSKLIVELYGTVLGTLAPKEGLFDFETDYSAFERYQLSSTIMSLAVPLNLRYTALQKKRSGNFFAELLPEGRNYEWLAKSLSHGEQTPFGMLRKYGRDIAGALTIYDPEDAAYHANAEIELVDNKKIRYLLEHMPQEALANSPRSGKTSLGGVQDKIVLAKKGESWHRVHNGYPSTHILKPVVPEYPTLIYDEAFCMHMAYASGLTSYPVWIETFDGADALVIERYDRDNNAGDNRVHQEDFNQVLGAHGSEKYQEYGGKVSARRIARILAKFGADKDVMKFASQLIFAIAIGNLDMHAKNVSVLHLPDESTTLAPTYDQVPLRHRTTDGNMALAINRKYKHSNILLSDIVSELTSWHCGGFFDEAETKTFVRNCLEIYNNAMNSIAPHSKAHRGIKNRYLFLYIEFAIRKSYRRG